MVIPTIILVGLGLGDPALLTPAARAMLEQATMLTTTTPEHPALAFLPAGRVRPLVANEPREGADLLASYAASSEQVFCALPGHPCDNPLTAALRQHHHTIRLQIVPGISMLDCFCAAFAIDRHNNTLQLAEASTLLPPPPPPTTTEPAWCEIQSIARYERPLLPYPLDPTHPALLFWFTLPHPNLSHIQHTLLLRYPSSHPLRLATLDQHGQPERAWEINLHQLDNEPLPATPAALYLPPLSPTANLRTPAGLEWVIMRLLGPDGCPWDRKQTFQSLRDGLLEETFEVLEALDEGDMAMLAEELGDMLLQVYIYSEMARQAGHFRLETVIEQVSHKLIRRHPHVFGSLEVNDNDEVLRNWEQIKAQELREKGRKRASALDGVPPALPALAATRKLIKKAARTGFEWDVIEHVWEKLREELGELAQACAESDTPPTPAQQQHIAEELGDVLFVVVNLANWLHVDAESALRETNTRFRRRFAYIEQRAHEEGRTIAAMSIAETLALWKEAKQALTSRSPS